MNRYLVTYLGGNPPSTPEEGQAHFKRYQAWLGDLGAAVESAMNPIKDTHLLGPDGSVTSGGSVGMSGFTVLKAGSIDEAVTMCESCPFLEIGGSLEVSELVSMQ